MLLLKRVNKNELIANREYLARSINKDAESYEWEVFIYYGKEFGELNYKDQNMEVYELPE